MGKKTMPSGSFHAHLRDFFGRPEERSWITVRANRRSTKKPFGRPYLPGRFCGRSAIFAGGTSRPEAFWDGFQCLASL
jgi:hypothetical protein